MINNVLTVEGLDVKLPCKLSAPLNVNYNCPSDPTNWIMTDSGAAVSTCPHWHAPDVPLDCTVTQEQFPSLKAANGNSLTAYGRKTVTYNLGQDFRLSVAYWVTDVSCPILATHDCSTDGLNTIFTDSGAFLFDRTGRCVQLVTKDNCKLYWIQTFGIVTETSTQSNFGTICALVSPSAATEDYWQKIGNKLIRLHVTPRRKLFSDLSVKHLLAP